MDRKRFYDAVRAPLFFGALTQSHVDGINGLLDAWAADGSPDPRKLAYVLAGVYHETGSKMVPVREGFAGTDAKARRIVAKRAYGKPAGPYGHVYYGRGRIQNTWLDNMEKLKKRFGLDFVKDPDLLLDPVVDARVTVIGHIEGIWTGKKLSDYFTAGKADYINARRIVNGTDKAKQIANYAAVFLDAINAAGGVPKQPEPAKPQPAKPASKAKTAGVGAVIASLMAAAYVYLKSKGFLP